MIDNIIQTFHLGSALYTAKAAVYHLGIYFFTDDAGEQIQIGMIGLGGYQRDFWGHIDIGGDIVIGLQRQRQGLSAVSFFRKQNGINAGR